MREVTLESGRKVMFIKYEEADDGTDDSNACERCCVGPVDCGTAACIGGFFREPSYEAAKIEAPTNALDSTIAQRGARYGKFADHARVTRELKRVFYANLARSDDMTPSMWEAIDMILHKIGRICTGDPTYADSWHDIAGYATLVDKELSGESI